MPSGLAQYVKGQGQDNNAHAPIGKDLARRRAEALSAKVQPKVFEIRSPAQYPAVHNRRAIPPGPTYVPPLRSHEQTDGDLFAGSVLSDSDDTTRDLDSSNMRGYQAMLPPQSRQGFGIGNGMEQDSEPGYQDEYGDDEEEHDYHNNAYGLENDTGDEDGQSRAFHFPTGTTSMDMEQALRLRGSQQFAEAEKLHNSKFNLSHLPPIHPGISGRFTAAKNLTGDARHHHSSLGSATEAHYKSDLQQNDQVISDELASNESDEDIHQANIQQHDQRHDGQLERTTGTRIATAHHSNGEQQEDRFRASELESDYSAGSSELSPSQHTPRASGKSHKQTSTSSQRGKRKKATLDLDYDTNTLSTMKYSELKEQPFDINPKAPASVILESLSGPKVTLEDRLEHLRTSEPDNQFSFFAHMPLDQWDQSGDWFLGRFGDIMSELKDARRAKRDVSKAFEEELATREEAVRGKAEGIQEVLRQMRAGGEGVLKGRAP
jgi:hypothetical protein